MIKLEDVQVTLWSGSLGDDQRGVLAFEVVRGFDTSSVSSFDVTEAPLMNHFDGGTTTSKSLRLL